MMSVVRHLLLATGVAVGWSFWPVAAQQPSRPGPKTMTATSSLYRAAAFTDVPGWAEDDHASAFAAFKRSCSALMSPPVDAPPSRRADPALLDICKATLALPTPDRQAARLFFEQHFTPNRLDAAAPGLLTAYYEPVVQGRRQPAPGFQVPLHRRPADLVNLVDEADRAAKPHALTHARNTPTGTVPFPTRQEIDQGALAGQNLELFYVADEVERFFLQVQGSGVIQLADGSQVRVTYDGKNGHPYTSVGRYLIDQGIMGADQMSLQAMGSWLRADPERGRRAIWQNKSYVFFREMSGATGPIGVMGVPLTPLRSLAIDPAAHALGLPIFVDAPEITHIGKKPFRHLMVGQDVGSAIKGPQRGDIYAGSGPAAGKIAGITKQAGRFFVLLPKAPPGTTRAP